MAKRFKVSVVIPIYNTEKYLRETIESVLHQSIGFLDNIQMILVNNATQDQSEPICLEYKEKYPINIVYIRLNENQGPCGARNAGQKVAEGKYINFLDSDDQWEEHAFEKIYDYFEQHYEEIDFVAGRIRRFEKYEEWDLFDFKFQYGNKIIDINEKPSFVQFSLCSVFVKTEVGKRYWHDERIRHAEDMKYLTEILFDKCRYGIVPSAIFKYRVRTGENSVFQTTTLSRNWYYETLKYSYFYLIEESRKHFGEVILYLQYILHSEIRGRLLKELPEEITGELKEYYLDGMVQILRVINDTIIWSEEKTSAEQKLYTFKLKYGIEYFENLFVKNQEVYFKDYKLLALNRLICIRNAVVLDDFSIIEGCLIYPYNLGLDIYNDLKVFDDDQQCYCIQKRGLDLKENIYSFGEKLTEGCNFLISIPAEKEKNIYFMFNGIEQKINLFSYASVNRLNYKFQDNYICYTPYMKNRIPVYFLFPFEKIEKGSKIIIYGAGYMGTQYYEQMEKTKYCHVVGMVDSNADKMNNSEYPLYTIDFVRQNEFDYIVIAIAKKEYVEEVISCLTGKGVDLSKIICEDKRNITWR